MQCLPYTKYSNLSCYYYSCLIHLQSQTLEEADIISVHEVPYKITVISKKTNNDT